MLSLDFKEAHPDTNWKVIVAMRHFLVHGYYQVDPEEVWNKKMKSPDVPEQSNI